jgi:putative tape measure domain protein|nr:MAG TPA: tail tape measure protein [Caudoviricetes sp.]
MDKQLKFLINLKARQDNVSSTVREVVGALNSIESKAKRVGESIRRALSFGSLSSELNRIPGLSLLTNPYALVGGGLAAVSKIGMQAEQTSIAFKTLVGNGERASQMLGEIAEFADRTPFDRMQLTEGARQMLSFGIEADKVTGYMRQLADVSGGDAQKFASLSLVFGQVNAAGKLMGQDLMQFVGAGFNPLKELAKMTGESYESLQDKMSKGQITAENVAQAIAHATGEGGQFYGMMDALGESGAGAWNTLMGSIQSGAVKIYEQVKPYLLDLFEAIGRYVPKVFAVVGGVIDLIVGTASFIKRWRKELLLAAWIVGVVTIALNAQAIAHSALAAVAVVAKVATAGFAAVQALLNAVMAANPIGLVITAIVILIGVVTYCWTKFAGFRAFLLTMWDTLKGFGGIIKDYVVNRINELLGAIGNVGKAIKLLFSGDFSGAADAVGEAAKGFVGVNSATQAYQSSKELIGGVGTAFDQHLATERAKDAAKKDSSKEGAKPQGISVPGLLGSGSGDSVIFGSPKEGKGGKGGRGKTGEAIATGGTRNTQITVHIGKLVERIQVSMMDKTDTAELERNVVSVLNRSLAIAISTDR